MLNTPWNEIATKIEIVDSLADAMREAGIDFHVSIRQGLFENEGGYQDAGDFKYIVRDDIPVALGTCKKRYSPLQNADAFGFFQDLIDDGVCTIDTVGKFANGRKVWVLAKLTNQYWNIVPHDKVQMYILFINSHDGEQSVLAGVLPVRVWCANMFHQLKGQDLIKFSHTGDVVEKANNAKLLIKEQLSVVLPFVNTLKGLAKITVSGVLLDFYFRQLFNCPEGKSTKSDNKIKRLKELFIHGKGNEDTYVRGTWYAAYNAATEYLSFEAGRGQESRIRSLWFGTNKKVLQKAFDLAVEMSQ